MMAESDDDIRIDDDEEIDEDEAFNEEDYSLYEGLVPEPKKKNKKSRRGKKSRQQSDDEDDEDEEDANMNDPDLKLLSDLFETDNNQKEEDDEDEDEDRVSRKKSKKGSLGDEDAHQNLLNVVSSLRSRPAKQTEQDEESEFNVKNKSGLSLSELVRSVQPLKGFEQTRNLFQSLNRQLPANLEPNTVVKDRNDRIAAYKSITKLVHAKWDPLVHEKASQKTRVFPEPEPIHRQTTGDLNKTFAAGNSFESDINAALLDAGFSLDVEHEHDDLKPNPLNPLEVQKRMAEVRRLRWKLANEETKRAWMKKIKSKSYRRIKKKIRERRAEQAESMAGLLDPDAEAERAAKADKLRALERVTMKHRANKFSKSLLRTNKQNPESRKALQEQIQLHQALRAKMEDAEADDGDAFKEAEAIEEMKEWQEEDRMLKKEDQVKKEEEEKEGGLMGMKFMKRGQEKARAEALLRKSRGGEDYEKSEDEDESDDEQKKLKKVVSELKKKEKEKKSKEEEMAVGHRREYNPSKTPSATSSSSSAFDSVFVEEDSLSSSSVSLVGESLQVSSVAFSNTRSTVMKTPINVRQKDALLNKDKVKDNEKKPDLPLLFEMAPFPSPSVPQPSINKPLNGPTLSLNDPKAKAESVPKEKPQKNTDVTPQPVPLDTPIPNDKETEDEAAAAASTPKKKGNRRSKKKPSLRDTAPDEQQDADEENPWLQPELLTRRSRDEKRKKKMAAADSGLQLDLNSALLLGSQPTNTDTQESQNQSSESAPAEKSKKRRTTGGFIEKVEKISEKEAQNVMKKPKLKEGVPVTIIEKKTEEAESDTEEKRERTKGSRLLDLSTYSQEQKALVQRAFEPDEEAYNEFRSEWDKTDEPDTTLTQASTLPGWGSWSANDENNKKKKNQNNDTNKKNPSTEKKPTKKKKTVSQHVLINQLNAEKLKPFQTNKSLYQIPADDAPIGHAWNPGLVVEKKIAPRAVVQPGLVIPALSRKDQKKPTPRKPLA